MPNVLRSLRPYTEAAALLIRSGQDGVYEIFSGATCILVDQTQDVRQAMLQHILRRSTHAGQIFQHNPTSWSYEPLPKHVLNARCRELVEELHPILSPNRAMQVHLAMTAAALELAAARRDLARQPGFDAIELGQDMPALNTVARTALRRLKAATSTWAACQDDWYRWQHGGEA